MCPLRCRSIVWSNVRTPICDVCCRSVTQPCCAKSLFPQEAGYGRETVSLGQRERGPYRRAEPTVEVERGGEACVGIVEMVLQPREQREVTVRGADERDGVNERHAAVPPGPK